MSNDRQIQPSPEQIKAARLKAGLTQGEAAKLVYVDLRTWQKWEGAERKMHPAMWELFEIKVSDKAPPLAH